MYLLTKTGNGKQIFQKIREYQQEGLKPMPKAGAKLAAILAYGRSNRSRKGKRTPPNKIHLLKEEEK